jgi:hypothetical protein
MRHFRRKNPILAKLQSTVYRGHRVDLEGVVRHRHRFRIYNRRMSIWSIKSLVYPTRVKDKRRRDPAKIDFSHFLTRNLGESLP